MGVAASTLRRSVKNWNVVHRAQRQIDKDQARPRMAPRLMKVDTSTIFSPSELERESDRNPTLESRVHQMKIQDTMFSTTGVLPGDEKRTASAQSDGSRKMPQRSFYEFDSDDETQEFMEPDVVPAGKITLRQSLNLIAEHKQSQFTIEELAKKYKLSNELVEQILHSFHPFTLKSREELKAQLLTASKEFSDETTQSEPVNPTSPINS